MLANNGRIKHIRGILIKISIFKLINNRNAFDRIFRPPVLRFHACGGRPPDDRLRGLQAAVLLSGSGPQQTGSGYEIDFFMPVALSGYPAYSSSIVCDSASDVFSGVVFGWAGGGATTAAYITASGDDTFAFNGAWGSQKGGHVFVKDIATGVWRIRGALATVTSDPLSDALSP